MRRINTLNKAVNLFGAGKHGWKNGVPGTADRPTEGQAEWFNSVQEELCSLIEAAELTIDPDDSSQVLDALQALFMSAGDLGNSVNPAKGDALIAVKQAFGSAVARTQHSKNSESISVLDFGAIGDGSADDTEAFQVALSALSTLGTYKRTLIVPAGAYKITSGLVIPNRVDVEGEGRDNTRLMFALPGDGICIQMEGSSGAHMRSALRRVRIDGTNCAGGGSVVGVLLNWNQGSLPVLEGVDIGGGYESNGAGTGLSTGLAFQSGAMNWIVNLRDVGAEGCRGHNLVIDTAPDGHANIINFFGCRFENSKGRNLYLKGPGDDVSSMQINFIGCTIEGASFQTTGVGESVYVAGCGANFSHCWFESHGTPNWPTFEVNVDTGARVNIHSCNFAWSQVGVRCGGQVVFSGLTTIRSASNGIFLAANGQLRIAGEMVFLGSGNPISSDAGTGVLDWARDAHVSKNATGTIPTSDFGASVSNAGAKAAVIYTLPTGVSGATLRVVNAATSLRNSNFEWRPSGGGTGEYYLTGPGGSNPNITKPTKVYAYGSELSEGAPGSLVAPRWGYGNNDSLGFNTIYYRDGGGDPDGFATDTIMASYQVTVTPSNGQRIVPLGTGDADPIVSDGVPGTSIKLRCVDRSWWLIEDRVGGWS